MCTYFYQFLSICFLFFSSLYAKTSNDTLYDPVPLVITPGVANLPYTLDGKIKVFHLVAEPVLKTIYDGKINLLEAFVKTHNRYSGPMMKLPATIQKIKGWGYNGNIPGPTIIVNENDSIRVHVLNKLPEPTTIHWHGILVPNHQDASGGTSDPVIAPGKSTTYEFQITNKPGTYMYRSSFNDAKQVLQGLAGLFIVLPQDNQDPADKDFAILLQDWMIPEGGEAIKYLSPDRNWFTFNGLCAPNFPVLMVDEGNLVRLRFANLGVMSHPIHLHGYSFQITGTEGGPIPSSAQWPGATVTISPGESRDIEFLANNPGLWRLQCTVLSQGINDSSYFARKDPKEIMPPGGLWTYLYVKPTQQNPKDYK